MRQAGHAQARHERDHRGVADGRRVHRPARQPRHRAVRARHPDVRDRDPQHPRHLAPCRWRTACRTCRSSSTRRTPAAAATWSLPLSRAAIAAGADGIIVDVHPHPETALCDGPQALVDDDLRALAATVRQLPPLLGRPPAPATHRAWADRLAGMKVSRADVLGLRVRAARPTVSRYAEEVVTYCYPAAVQLDEEHDSRGGAFASPTVRPGSTCLPLRPGRQRLGVDGLEARDQPVPRQLGTGVGERVGAALGPSRWVRSRPGDEHLGEGIEVVGGDEPAGRSGRGRG